MKIRAIVKRPDEVYGHVANISADYKNFQRIVGGYIETVYVTDEVVVLCNEEGLLQNLPFNLKIHGHDIVGTIIVLGEELDEFADLKISFDDWKYIVDVFNMGDKLRVPQNHADLIWHVIDEDDLDTYPKTKDYILLNFSNCSQPSIGRCEGNKNVGFTFYDGDDDTPLCVHGFFVDAWMPLPKRYEA